MWRALAALLLVAPSAQAAEPAWIAERGEKTVWQSNAVWRPVALARATRTPEPISVNVLCTIEKDVPVLRLHYRDADRIAQREWQPAMGARVDGDATIELEHVDRADWQSHPLPGSFRARLRAGSFLVIERRDDPLRLQLTGMREALDQLDRMCAS
jgi:hypothetical protein